MNVFVRISEQRFAAAMAVSRSMGGLYVPGVPHPIVLDTCRVVAMQPSLEPASEPLLLLTASVNRYGTLRGRYFNASRRTPRIGAVCETLVSPLLILSKFRRPPLPPYSQPALSHAWRRVTSSLVWLQRSLSNRVGDAIGGSLGQAVFVLDV